MTEAEWWAENHLYRMLMFIRPRWNPRATGLFGAGCCRQVWEHITDDALRTAVEVSERFADGGVTVRELRRAERLAQSAASRARGAERIAAGAVVEVVGERPSPPQVTIRVEQILLAGNEEPLDLAVLLRDIFGNPFRPVAFSPLWRTDTVVSLARGMYESRDFSAMPILADALQDAGCDSDDVLNHCRDANQTHVRGCWVVDLVLSQE